MPALRGDSTGLWPQTPLAAAPRRGFDSIWLCRADDNSDGGGSAFAYRPNQSPPIAKIRLRRDKQPQLGDLRSPREQEVLRLVADRNEVRPETSVAGPPRAVPSRAGRIYAVFPLGPHRDGSLSM